MGFEGVSPRSPKTNEVRAVYSGLTNEERRKIQGLTHSVLQPDEILEKIWVESSPRWRALISFLWITGARISEALSVRGRDMYHRTLSYDKLRGEYIQREALIVDLPILKRKRTTKQDPLMRTIAVVADEDKPFRDIVEQYMKLFKDKNDKLFPVSRVTAYNHIKRILGVRPHFLRHSRLTWLCREKGFNDQMLRQYVGWADSRPAKTYVHLNYKDAARKMLEG